MTGYEVVVLLAGIAFLIFSFLVGKNEEEGTSVNTSEEILKIKEAAVFQENELRTRVNEILEKEAEDTVSEAEDKLNHISNEKIIAVDDYSRQILEKIENNHQEVVFLYDMLQKKEEEMKSTMNKMEQTRRENKELFERLEELKAAKARVNSRNAAAKSGAVKPAKEMAKADSSTNEKQSVKPSQANEESWDADEFIRRNSKEKEDVLEKEAQEQDVHPQREKFDEAVNSVKEIDTNEEENGMTEEEKKETILQLYKQHKSVREISKKLSMGQGEVKLIIDLYAK